jgi:hypothetical protein
MAIELGGLNRKGGHNPPGSQVKKRPAPPAPMRPMSPPSTAEQLRAVAQAVENDKTGTMDGLTKNWLATPTFGELMRKAAEELEAKTCRS